MAVFTPRNRSLYRRLRRAVIFAVLGVALVQVGRAQYSKRTTSKGPRALGLLELAPNGAARLIPITILIEGKFYDAGAYKAAPVPMALEPQTVYEALRTGVSQGLFTVANPLARKNNWIAQGNWLPAGATPPKTSHAAEDKPNMGSEEGPPTLRRGVERPADNPPAEIRSPAATQSSTSTAPTASTSTPTAQAPAGAPASTPSPSTATAPAETPAPTAAETSAPAPEDKNRPVLRRGKPKRQAKQEDEDTVRPVNAGRKAPANSSKPSTTANISSGSATPAVQLIPAISDADGPDPHPYTYEVKADEEQKYRQKILPLAGEEIRTRARQLSGSGVEAASRAGAPGRRGSTLPKAPQPAFDDVQLRFFDLSSSNEPVLVLTATAHMTRAAGFAPAGQDDLKYFITLVARVDIYGELRKLFSNVTDTRHLDASPRMELIDAVDADGDGRGELLFRQISDAGTAFDVYRVTGDQLWPLFEGTPQ